MNIYTSNRTTLFWNYIVKCGRVTRISHHILTKYDKIDATECITVWTRAVYFRGNVKPTMRCDVDIARAIAYRYDSIMHTFANKI